MTDVVQLVPKPVRIQRNIIDTLKDALVDAEAGRFVAVCVVGITPAHGSVHRYSEMDQRFALAGGLFAAAQELVSD